MQRPRIFIGLENIAGYSSMLKKGFDALGINCDVFTRGAHRFQYPSDKQNPVANLFNHIFGLYKFLYQHNNLLLKICGHLIDACVVSFLFLYALVRYDVFIFTYKNCFFQHLGFIDLPLLKRLKKTIIFVFHGSDTRPPYINGAYLSNRDIDEKATIDQIHRRTRKQKKDILTIEKYADFLVSGPATSHFHKRKIISFFYIGIPYDIQPFRSTIKTSQDDTIKILHSPSNPEAKGTDTIRSAIGSLKQKGYPIKYIEIIDQPNHVVLEKLDACDFVVDQMYSPTPMPGFITEAATFGKAAVICGYFCDQIHTVLPSEKIPPSHYRHPDEIEASIERLIVDKPYRMALGKKAQTFVQQHWHSQKVAERFLKIINHSIPEDWYYNPMDITDVHGACLSQQKAKKVVKSLVDAYGKDALCLADKPILEKRFLEFAYSS
jgi:hypothetical protein